MHAVGVMVEDVQAQSRNQRIATGALLVRESGIRAGLDVKPCAPFIHDDADTAIPPVFVTYSAMTSLRKPRVLGIGESSPTHRPS
jgi:hypothetical protein